MNDLTRSVPMDYDQYDTDFRKWWEEYVGEWTENKKFRAPYAEAFMAGATSSLNQMKELIWAGQDAAASSGLNNG